MIQSIKPYGGVAVIKSINLWSFPVGYSIEQCLDKALSAGFLAVEPNFAIEGELSFHSSDTAILEIKRKAADRGVSLASLSTGVYWDAPPTHDDPAVRRRAAELIHRQLEVAALLGVGAILVVPGLVGADFIVGSPVIQYDKAYDRALEFIADAAPYAKDCSVVIGVENVWNKMLLSPLEMRDFIDACDSPFVKVYFDVGNVLAFGYPEHWVRILGSRIVRVHVKDFKQSVGNINGFTDLLAGDVNFPEVIKALREIGYDGYITAEMGRYNHYSDQVIDSTSAAMDRILSMK
jgi:L-ribulose-5-phosphate 3-epimerase